MDANRDLSVMFSSLRKKILKKKAIRNEVQQSDQNGDDDDDSYLQEVTYSPGNTSVNSTTNFCNSDGRRSKLKKTILDTRGKISHLQQTYSNEFTDNVTSPNLLTINNRPPPLDKYGFIYYSLILSGIGFLLPYNSFVVGAVDYFQDRFPNTTIIFDLSSIYIVVQFVAVCINNTLISLISFKIRICFGYVLSLGTLIFMSIFELGYDLLNENGYQMNLFFVAIVAFGCTVQQSSFYGFTSMLPLKYTQAILIGESMSGLVVSFSRIVTKYFIKDEQLNTLVFFIITIFILIVCLFINYYFKDDEFIQYYVNHCKKENSNLESYLSTSSLNTSTIPKNSIQENNIELIVQLNQTAAPSTTINNTADVPKSDSTEFDLPFGIDEEELVFYVQQPTNNSIQTSSSATARCLPNYCKRSSSQTELETNLISTNQTNLESLVDDLKQHPKKSESQHEHKVTNYLLFTLFKQYLARGLDERLKITYVIWPHMISVALAYILTLSLFPGVESVIENCDLKSWTPVLLFFVFNCADLVGKFTARTMFEMSGKQLLFFCFIRFLLLPLFILCIVPNEEPILSNFFFIFTLTLLLGISNGIFGSLPMILAGKYVANKELAGNLMTISYCVGLCFGTILSYVIESMFFDIKNHQSICSD